jgi:very-short-patch-repair endonuclease
MTDRKTKALLSFLKETAALRRKRISAYGETDRLLWLEDLPHELPQTWREACRSAFNSDNPADIPDLWLEVRKRRKPTFPPLSKELQDWVPQGFQDRPDEYINKEIEQLVDLLSPQITVTVEKRVLDPDAPPGETRTFAVSIPEVRRLDDYPEVEEAWIEYLERQWEPWAEEMRWWSAVQDIYEKVDFMRRRLEEAEERYELLLAVGLLQWRDSTGVAVKRHLLTAPAEITLDAARGVLTVGPAVSFDGFHVELDMLELQDRPRLEATDVADQLKELDVRAWDTASVAKILRVIANSASADAQVSEDAWVPLERTDDTFRVLYAPALVLRERRPTAYEELISRLLEAAESEPEFATTAPWRRFLDEGKPSSDPTDGNSTGDSEHAITDTSLYFPLPTNDEQQRIAERLRRRPFVLVKGPPGTGKSHTIANLICHLLATGERVLVTAHAPKALTVLRQLLPGDIRNLCVTAFGSSREDHRLLEDSVRGILARKNEWRGEEWAKSEIDRLQRKLHQLEDERAKMDRRLRACREAETHSHTLSSTYTGTAPQIARQIERDRATHGWFPELNDDQQRCPLQPEEVELLADVHASLTPEWLNELRLEIGCFSLPDRDEFAATLQKLNSAESAATAARGGAEEPQLDVLQGVSDASLAACWKFLNALEEQAVRASRALGDLTSEILKDVLVGQTARWDRLERETAELIRSIQLARERIGTATIDVPSKVENAKLLHDVRRRLKHLRYGGWRGWGFLAPRVMRETKYIETCCRVNAEVPRTQQSLETLLGYLELKEHLETFYAAWPAASAARTDDPRRAATDVCELVEQFSELLKFLGGYDPRALHAVPIESREALAEHHERAVWRRSITAELARRFVRAAKEPLDEWLRMIQGVLSAKHHPCMVELERAIVDRDPVRWHQAWEERESLRRSRDRLQQYENLVERIDEACPKLAVLVRSTQGDHGWSARLRQLQQAWDWRAAKAWLSSVVNPEHCTRLAEERHRLQHRIEKKLEELATLKAWRAFFTRLDDETEQNLTAWTKAVTRIGKGTGKHAYRHRRAARQYLMACIPQIPAWIMPLHKVWETVDPRPGVFDTLIVDEASQAGIEALALMLLARRIVVVGDDKQNSPEAVGVLEDDIARLARDYLSEYRFRDEFRPDTSLYDHAERAFGNVISLREHFRCVPEIIRFSNDLCYTDAPLIPLRQAPPNRLPPLKAEFVEQGHCEGGGQRILNRAEAEAIVETIRQCVDDEAYEGRTMGVIVLQGHAQAEFIEKRLADELEPRVRQERKLRCGVPATFQGDQRDVIFLSLVVAPNHSFRALTELEAQRRFNVAMSRARDQVWLFHSVQQHDLSREDLRWRLLHFFNSQGRAMLAGLYEELDRLEHEVMDRGRQVGEQPNPFESWFEVDVAIELLRRKYRLRPQVEVAGYRIDLVVEGSVNRLAVECDGEAWHGPEQYEHDVARQRQLERAGWTFVRVRESEFYADRESAVRRIVDACRELGIRPVGEEELEEEEPNTTTTSGEEASPQEREDAEQAEYAGGEEQSLERTMSEAPQPAHLTECCEQLNLPDPRDASPANVRAALRRLIEEEGPLTKRLLIRLYVEGCTTLHRAGKTVRSSLNRSLYSMQKAGEIVVEDELGDRSLESQVIRLAGAPRVRERSVGQRDLLEIPPSELFMILDRIVASSPRSEDDESLMRRLLDHYGFSRLTQNRQRHLHKVLHAYRCRAKTN